MQIRPRIGCTAPHGVRGSSPDSIPHSLHPHLSGERNMMRKTLSLVAAAAFVATSVAGAQKGGSPMFNVGYTDVGPTFGLGGLNAGANAAFGGRFEHGLKALPDMGNGMLGIQVAADYYSA